MAEKKDTSRNGCTRRAGCGASNLKTGKGNTQSMRESHTESANPTELVRLLLAIHGLVFGDDIAEKTRLGLVDGAGKVFVPPKSADHIAFLREVNRTILANGKNNILVSWCG
jgi:hypothetical protein